MSDSLLPGVTEELVVRWSGTWSDDGLWSDVRWLADRLWGAVDPEARAVAWHHLVLAVGNFKRQWPTTASPRDRFRYRASAGEQA